MNKKLLILFVLLCSGFVSVFSNSFMENEYFKKSLEYKRLAEIAYDEAEYDKTIEYSQLAAEYAEKSDQYIAYMLKMYKANTALVTAKRRLAYAESINLPQNDQKLYAEAKALVNLAGELFEEEDFDNSRLASLDAIELLKEIKPLSKDVKPKYYVVNLIPERRDCFWRIAEYPFIYNDPTLWEKIYHANKDKMVNPNNPDLIHPGLVLEIPELDGETRQGTYNPK